MVKEKEAIGIDVGLQALKLVRLRQKGSSVEILDYRIKEYAQSDATKAEVYKEASSFIRQAREAVPVIASIEGDQVFTRVFKLPAVGKGNLAKIIGYEAQQQVPFPIADVVWSYQRLREVSPEETDVVLVAVKGDVVEGFLNSFKQLGISIDDVVAPIIGLYHLLGYQLPEQSQATLILDLGAKTTNIIIVEKQNLWFRMVPLGGEVITQAVGQGFNLGLTEAETFKREKGHITLEASPLEDLTSKKVSSCIVRSLTRLTGEIARSIEVYSSSFNSLGIKRILITGGTSRLKNIDQFLAKKFRVDVKGLDVLKGFNMVPTVKKEKFLQDAPCLGVGLGLALQGLGLARLNLSLLPREVVRERQWSKRQAYIKILFLLLIFLGFSFSGYNIQLSNMYKASIYKLESDKKAVDFNKEELAKIQHRLDAVRSKVDIVNKVVNAKALWMDMLLALEELIPQNVWLTRIEPIIKEEPTSTSELQKLRLSDVYPKDYLDLNLHGKTTGTYHQVETFRDALDESGYFLEGTTEVVSAKPPKDGVRDFVIKVRMRTQIDLENQ